MTWDLFQLAIASTALVVIAELGDGSTISSVPEMEYCIDNSNSYSTNS